MRTRGSTADSDDDEMPVPPPPPPPQRRATPPPPPPLPAARRATPPSPAAVATVASPAQQQPPVAAPLPPAGREQQQQQQQHAPPVVMDQQLQLQAPPPPPALNQSEWVLRVRHPGKGMLRIHVPAGMTAYLLSKCIIQATDIDDDAIVGLFGYSDGIFVSLEHLLAATGQANNDNNNHAFDIHKQVYSLFPPQPTPQKPWWETMHPTFWMGIILAIVLMVWQNQPYIWSMSMATYLAMERLGSETMRLVPVIYHRIVTIPMQDTYRYGPSFMGGWEGASLTAICARMTYGDEDFWERNFEDCQNMYHAKESAFVFVGRPLMFLVVLGFVAWIIKQYMWHQAMRDRDRYRDRDMIETYRAIQVLFRQSNRMLAGNNTNNPRHFQQRRHNDNY